MGEFSPVQLDALEDALEDLELVGIPDAFDDDAAVSGRLSEYRALLQLSREALPLEEVRAGVLKDVLALAREESVAANAETTAPSEDAVATPWWKRLSLWVPMLAVGASAALVLVMVRGTLTEEAPAETVATASKTAEDAKKEEAPGRAEPLLERADELQAVAEPAADGDDELALGGLETRGRLRGSAATDMPASALDDGEADSIEEEAERPRAPQEKRDAKPTPEEPAAVVPAKPTDPTDKVLYDRDERKSNKKSSASSGAGKQPSTPSKPSPPPEPEPPAGGGSASKGSTPDAKDGAESASDPLATAERERKAGRCGAARSIFDAHLDDADASVRARALAGLGLCALAGGDSEAADAFFARAKKADPSVGGFITRERAKLEPAKQGL